MNIDRVEVFHDAATPTDQAGYLDFSFFHASARLSRYGKTIALWSLCRVAHINPAPAPATATATATARARVFIFPTSDIAHPPASLWIANLREQALLLPWSEPSDIWTEVIHSGGAGYDFNRIHDHLFAPSGETIDSGHSTSWPEYALMSGLPLDLLCRLPWDGLAAMWGPGFHSTYARAEALAIQQGLPPLDDPSEKPRRISKA